MSLSVEIDKIIRRGGSTDEIRQAVENYELREIEERRSAKVVRLSSWASSAALVAKINDAACSYCDATNAPLQVDHIQPRSRGGDDHWKNLTPACRSCNASKGNRTVWEWRAGLRPQGTMVCASEKTGRQQP